MSLIIWIQAAFAAQVALQVDSADLREGQSVALELVVVDTTVRGVPEIPVPDGLQVTYRSQSQQRSIMNFQSTVSTTYSYALTALNQGTYVLEPVEVITSAGPLRTAAVRLTVAPRGSAETDTLKASVDLPAAWVGQIRVYHLRFQTEKRVVTGRWSPPTGPGFTAEPSVEPSTTEYTLTQDGKPLAVQELFYPIRISAPGKWSIPGGVLQAQFAVTQRRQRRPAGGLFEDGGFGVFDNVRSEVYSAEPIALHPKAVPTEGRPANATDLVGQFTIAAKSSASSVLVGETVTVEVTLEGDGDLAGFTLPPIEGEAFRVYDDQPVVVARIEDGHYRAVATFKRAIVPQTSGVLDIPPIYLAYFDPIAGAWASVATEPLHLIVGGEAATAQVDSYGSGAPRSVDALGEDILPVRTDPRTASAWFPPEAALVLLAPGAVALAAQGLRRVRRRPAPAAQKRLDFEDLPADPEERLAGIEQIFRERIGGVLGVAPAGLRREDLARLSEDADVADALYRELERLRYGAAGSALPEARVRAFIERLR